MKKESTETGFEVAIIGMSARFPGARDIDELWQNLSAGRETISFFSPTELAEAGISGDWPENPDYVKACGIAEGNDCFDSYFFDYTPKEVELMAPQIRLFHEGAWTALEDAGYDPGTYHGLIGLYAGSGLNFEWEALSLLSGRVNHLGIFASSQLTNKDFLCMRVSHKLNLTGPSLSIYTTCSTSLVAIHLACQALINGECDMALAGGIGPVNLIRQGYLYQEGMVASPDGHCRAFDARATGIAPGEGMGIVVLKRLRDAAADRDHIRALIKGSAINNDGIRKVGFTAPSIEGQAEVIKASRQMAEVEPESITYIETHGTGTGLGDPVEIEALTLAFDTNKKGYCAIGSVKTNFGHTDTAAGAAGLIKTVLALEHKLIPPSLHFETPNPNIHFANTPFYVNTGLSQWQGSESPLRAGVSSFGLGGTNAHIILEEAPRPKNSSQERTWKLLLLSAKTRAALERATVNLSEFLKYRPGINLSDAAYTLQAGRKALPYRRMLVCSHVEEAIAALTGTGTRKIHSFHAKNDRKSIIFMFPGLGAQYINMGLYLYRREKVFRQETDRCFKILKSLTGYDMKEILYPDVSVNAASSPDSSLFTGSNRTNRLNRPNRPNRSDNSYAPAIHHIEIAQPAVFALEYGLARLLSHWGITPHAMIGYSFGEYTAACLSGVFSLEDALKLVVTRGQLISRLSPGSLLSVPLPVSRVKPLLKDHHQLSIAIDNGPSCIVAGPAARIEEFATRLKEKKYICMKLPNSHALHSIMMEPILKEFERQVGQVTRNSPRIPFISNLTGTWLTVAEARDPGYWARHLRETVQFASGLKELKKESNPVFIEVGPGRDLCVLLNSQGGKKGQGNHQGCPPVNLIRAQQQEVPDDRFLMSKIGQLWLYGTAIDWQAFYSQEKRNRIPLPTYSFERQRFEFEGYSLLQQMLSGQFLPLPPDKKESTTGKMKKQRENNETFPGRHDLDTPYLEPANETEQAITGIWQHLFGIGSIGILDDFFALGGNSVLSVTMLSQIHRQLGARVPLAEVYNHPTPQKLAEYIRGKEKAEEFKGLAENLVLLKQGSKKAANFFFLNNGYNEVAAYAELCKHLTADFTFWGVCAQPIKNYAPRNILFETLAAESIESIRDLQSHGPYYIGGWSMGGLLAFEVVRQLEKMNREVRKFTVIDAPSPTWNHGKMDFDFSVETDLNWVLQYLPGNRNQIKERTANLAELTQFWSMVVAYLEEVDVDINRVREAVPQEMKDEFPDFYQLDLKKIILYINTMRTFARAESKYVPAGRIEAPTYLFQALASSYMGLHNRWQDHCANIVKTYRVKGNHVSIFRMPAAAAFAAIFDRVIHPQK